MIPSLIKDCSVKINGSDKIIGIAEFSIPEVTYKEEEINVLGIGAYKEVMGSMPEAMGTTIKFLGLHKTALRLKAGKGVNLVLAAAIQVLDENDNLSEIAMFTNVRGTIKSHKFGVVGSNGKLEPEIEINLTYFKIEVDGDVLYEIDQKNKIMIIDGEDLRAGINAITE